MFSDVYTSLTNKLESLTSSSYLKVQHLQYCLSQISESCNSNNEKIFDSGLNGHLQGAEGAVHCVIHTTVFWTFSGRLSLAQSLTSPAAKHLMTVSKSFAE